jgi:hypothetical protein
VNEEDRGRAMYEAFRESVFGIAPATGRPLPPWEELSEASRAALNGVIDEVAGAPA